MKKNLKNVTLEELKQFCSGEGMQPYRATQIFRWIWKKDKGNFSEITTLSKRRRELLEEKAEIKQLKRLEVLTSKDKTMRFLFGLPNGEAIESVYIPTSKRKTVCISTQLGCPLNCKFCMTGKTGFIRNLLPWEIADQVRRIESITEKRITNVVLMGLGEPLLNYKNVLQAIKILNSDMGMNIGARKITISTAGIVPGILQLANEPLQVKLAISLNASNDVKRDKLMPINKKYNLRRLFDAIEEYIQMKGKRITFEYVLIKDFNDSPNDARELAELTKEIPCKINIIPLNPIDKSIFRKPSLDTIQRFINVLYPIAQAVTLRESRGIDIEGACGQLRIRRRSRRQKKTGHKIEK